MCANELVQADMNANVEFVPLSQDEIKTYTTAYQPSWCLGRLLAEVSQDPSSDTDSKQKLYESSGNVYLSAPRKGFKCFVENCPVMIEDAKEWAESPIELTGCQYDNATAIPEALAIPELEQ
jgi:hypothetical protein